MMAPTKTLVPAAATPAPITPPIKLCDPLIGIPKTVMIPAQIAALISAATTMIRAASFVT